MQMTETATAADETPARRELVGLWFVLLRIPELLLAALIAVLVVFLTASVISRYVFDVGIVWSDELARVLFIWVVYIGFAVGLRHRGNIAVDWLVEKLSPRWKLRVHVVQDIVILLFCLFFTWQSVATLRFSFIQRLPALQVRIAWLYAAVLVAAVLMTIYAVANVARYRAPGCPRHGP